MVCGAGYQQDLAEVFLLKGSGGRMRTSYKWQWFLRPWISRPFSVWANETKQPFHPRLKNFWAYAYIIYKVVNQPFLGTSKFACCFGPWAVRDAVAISMSD